ncbi:MAG: hypothetical protein A3K18_30275 [Lentisphaerae bacterium RIFOXYA12_64_32]|nr:MAG: hypothetical protein A3K18_30275 [Lentisphaerae bacterium RIFOXYA12_64_32]
MFLLSWALSAPYAKAQEEDWRIESRPFASGAPTAWKAVPDQSVRDATDRPVLLRKGIGLSCLSRVFDVDLDSTPGLEIVTVPGNAAWRLTAVPVDSALPDDDTLLADCQAEGTCRRNVKERMGLSGRQRLLVRLTMWGWGGSDQQCLTLEKAGFVAERSETDADGMSGLMLTRHQAVLERAATIRPVKQAHPSLRYRDAEKQLLRQRAYSDYRPFAAAALATIDSIATEKALPDVRLDSELLSGSQWRQYPLRLAPPQAPALSPGKGWNLFDRVPGEDSWRPLYWHLTSQLVIGSALTDDPVFAEQAKRWALTVCRWKFWCQPGYAYFDFGTSYPLQNLCQWYDIGYGRMSEEERTEVREAIAQLAHGLYLNALTGHGSIYNDLRGNHTAVSFCGLGTAGLALIGEHAEAAQWVALAEQFMLDAFAEHTSGAWTESPCYGNYGVSEWLRLAELLRNVTGRDHFQQPFLKRYADFSLMISDWEGRNLAYNQGGEGSRWNHWIFFCIAREWRYPEAQWLALFDLHDNPTAYMGYGDAFWWVDPSLQAVRPTERNAGRSFDDVGVNVWRSGWEDAATIVLHHCGRKGQHKEQNMNHFTLYALGQRCLPDGIGTTTRDHNVPVIAGRNQNNWGPGQTLMYHTDTRCGYSLGDASQAYGCPARRHVLYLREGLVCLVDDLDLGEAPAKTAEFLLHPNGQTRVSGNVVKVESGDVVLRGLFADLNGTLLPVTVNEREKKRFATHDVIATRSEQGPTRTVTFLRFGPKNQIAEAPCTVEPGAGYLDLRCGPERWRLGFGPGPIVPEWSTDAGLWLCRLDGGIPSVVMAVGTAADAPVSIQARTETVAGTGCVSWPVKDTRKGFLERWLPFLSP